MNYSLGVALIVIGLIHLAANEPVVRLKRAFKPWWRADDPVQDAILCDCLRAMVFIGGVICIELGIWLAGVALASWAWRVALYGLAGVLTVVVRYLIRGKQSTDMGNGC